MSPSASVPQEEVERLVYLHALGLLDTPAEERFDRLTKLVQRRFKTPMVLITLIDEKRQWFKSRQGLDLCETSRDVSFCAYAILGDEPLIIQDAREDERFSDNIFVTGEPFIRFYAGCPLRGLRGYRLGTLCIVDYQPRTLSQLEIEQLREMARAVEHEIHITEMQKFFASQESDRNEASQSKEE